MRPDGFRLDAVKHVPLSFWARYNDDVRKKGGPGFLLLGEMLDGDAAVLARTQREGRFGAMFDFPLYFALIDVFCRDQAPLRLAAALSSDRAYDDPDSLVTLLDNHDLPRVASDCRGDLERVRAALTVQLTARGTPAITWGTESALQGEKEPFNRGDMDFARQPLREHIARLMKLRREHPAIYSGASRLLAADGGTFAYARVAADELAVVAVNKTERPWKLDLPTELRGTAREALSGAAVSGEALEVPAGATQVYLIAPRVPGGFSEAARAAREQWRSGGKTRAVEVAATNAPLEPGDQLVLVGSGPEMGAWNPERGLGPLAADGTGRFHLPVESVFEFKLVIRKAKGGVRWEQAGNRSLFVGAGDGPLKVQAAWSD